MHDKNEGIYLWLLEQDRQRNRSRLLKETNPASASVPSSIALNSYFNVEKTLKEGCKPSKFIETTGIGHFTRERASLEKESRRLDEERKKLNLRVKIALALVQEIKRINDEKSKALEQLQIRIDELEAQLGELPFSDVPTENGTVRIENNLNESASEPSQRALGFDENGVVVKITKKIE